jgi:hypothetical protein
MGVRRGANGHGRHIRSRIDDLAIDDLAIDDLAIDDLEGF